MKQTLKPKIVPMEKVGYRYGDVIKYEIGVNGKKYEISQWPTIYCGQAQQVLLVDENAPIGVGDTYLDDADCIRVAVMDDPGYWSVRLDYHKIIASHPQIEGTLPISPETLRAIVECDGECTITPYPVFDSCQNDEGNGCVGCLGNGEHDCAAKMKYRIMYSDGCIMVDVVRNEPVAIGKLSYDFVNDKPKITFDTGRVAIRESVTVGTWTDEDMLQAYTAGMETMVNLNALPAKYWLTSYKQSKQTT